MDTLDVVTIMGSKHSSVECQLVLFFLSRGVCKYIFQWENYVIFHIFQQIHIENNQSPVCTHVCVRMCLAVFPDIAYKFDDKSKKSAANTHLLYKLVWGSQNNSVHSDFILILFIYVAVSFFVFFI